MFFLSVLSYQSTVLNLLQPKIKELKPAVLARCNKWIKYSKPMSLDLAMHEFILVCLLLFYFILLRKYLNWSYKCTEYILNHVLFLSCSLERTDLCCSVLFGDLVYLRKRRLHFEVLYLHQKPQRFSILQFWSGLQELWVSALPRITRRSV